MLKGLRINPSLICRKFNSCEILRFNLITVQEKNDAIELTYSIKEKNNTKKCIFPLVWFRDHCKNEKLFDWTTKQKKSNCTNLLEQSTLNGTEDIAVEENGKSLNIKWKDGIVSHFPLADILDEALIRKPVDVPAVPWDAQSLQAIPRIEMSTFSFSNFAQLFIKYGVVIIDGVEATAQATEQLCRNIGPIHNTFFGEFWVFSNKSEGDAFHEDTAYGNETIGPHTDGTYFDSSPGIQVFHCLQPAEIGGDTVITDGLRCAEILKKENPEAYKILTTREIDHHYLEGGTTGSSLVSLARQRKVIELDNNDIVRQIRFNPYDRSALHFIPSHGASSSKEASELISFYKAYSAFSKICHTESLSFKQSLRPGSVIFIDNFRVFHARTGFKGTREMAGCYMSRDNLLAKARPFFDKNVRYFL